MRFDRWLSSRHAALHAYFTRVFTLQNEKKPQVSGGNRLDLGLYRCPQ